ncbi:MAG: hypothetical protein RR277_08175 [Rikenellaceae bacterium]
MNNKLADLSQDQLALFRKSSSDRTGEIRRSIESIAKRTTMHSGKFVLEYPLSIKYRDMKKTFKGTVKDPHEFIFLRPVYGNILGSKRKGKQRSFHTIILSEVHRRYQEKIENDIYDIIKNG